MVKFIVLSEDSAFNTHLFLQSLKAHVIGEYSCTVIYKASTAEYSLMYESVLSDFADICDYVKVEGFKTQILSDLDERTDEDFVCLCTSEDIFYRPFLMPALDELFKDDQMLAFHTRLGHNIKQNSVLGAENIFKPLSEEDKVCIWDWSLHYVDFGDPFTLSGSIYRKSDIRKLINKIPFESREDLLEGFGMFGNYHRHKAACHSKSSLLTQAKDLNQKTSFLTKMLTNIRLLKGERIKFVEFDISKTKEVAKDIGVLKMLTGENKAKV